MAKIRSGYRGDMGFSTNTALREIDALIRLVRQLGPMPFQKTVLLFSAGLTRPPDQLEYWDSLIRRATSGGVTFYALDVYGMGVCQGDTDPDCVAHSTMAPAKAMLAYIAAQSAAQGPAAQGGVTQATQSGRYPIRERRRGCSGCRRAAAQGPSSTSKTAQMRELAHQDDYLKFMANSANRQEALRELTERTGGF